MSKPKGPKVAVVPEEPPPATFSADHNDKCVGCGLSHAATEEHVYVELPTSAQEVQLNGVLFKPGSKFYWPKSVTPMGGMKLIEE